MKQGVIIPTIYIFSACAGFEKAFNDLSYKIGPNHGELDMRRPNRNSEPPSDPKPDSKSQEELERENVVFQMRTVGIEDSIEALTWHENGFEYRDAGNWKNNGFLAIDAKEWKTAQVPWWEAKEWRENRFTPSEARNWRGTHFKPSVAEGWKDAGFMPEEAPKWYPCVQNPEVAVHWKAKGLPPDDACKIEGGLLQIESVTFTPDEYAQWKDTFGNIDLAAQLKGLGLNLVQAEAKYQQVMRRCSNKIGSSEDLFSANPYDIAGKCFEVSADGHQLLGKNKALYTISDGSTSKIAYVTFPKESAKTRFVGVVMSEGIYKYTTTAGSIAIVPRLSVIVAIRGQ